MDLHGHQYLKLIKNNYLEEMLIIQVHIVQVKFLKDKLLIKIKLLVIGIQKWVKHMLIHLWYNYVKDYGRNIQIF